MKITRIVDGKELEFELTSEELVEACKQHFANENAEYIRSFVEEDEDFADLSEEEREEIIKNVAYDMVKYIQVDREYADYAAYYECSKDYRRNYGDDEGEDIIKDSFDKQLFDNVSGSYVVVRHSYNDGEGARFEKLTTSLKDAVKHCLFANFDGENDYAFTVQKEDGTIFEVTRQKEFEVDGDDCATQEELDFLTEVVEFICD